MISSKITLKQLEGFVCVVDAGSFRKAAEMLGTTQPNVSNRIATLEQSLGVVLMHRDAGSVRLTDKGLSLLVAARQVLRSAEDFVAEAGRTDLIAHRLRLGVTELIACTWLHPFLRRFRDRYPSVSVALDVDLSTEMERRLADGRSDLVLMVGAARTGSETEVPLGIYPYCWVAVPEIAARFAGPCTIGDFAGQTVVAHSRQTSAARELVAHCQDRRFATDRLVFSSSLLSLVQMAVDGMGVALVPTALARPRIAAGALVELACDWHPTPLEFHARYDRARATGFIRYAAELAAQVSQEADAQNNFF